ncbi:hypothetical protein Q9L58_009400 [Maublancomyces gigas]|uniref:Uncharacterized protein n=1 Tax=Discina gigas TaxID=1032678 RepID=A0ABR3G6Z1_9PEZI
MQASPRSEHDCALLELYYHLAIPGIVEKLESPRFRKQHDGHACVTVDSRMNRPAARPARSFPVAAAPEVAILLPYEDAPYLRSSGQVPMRGFGVAGLPARD